MSVDARTITYAPIGGALQLFRCRDREIVMHGPAGTGKTRAALEKMYLVAQKYPGMRGLIVRKTRSSLTESAMVTMESKVVLTGVLSPQDVRRQFRHSYDFINGSSIVLGGMDNADRIMSTEFDMILVIEATELTEDDFEKLQTRLRNGTMPYQQIIAECNPSGPHHWIKRRIDSGRATEVVSRHKDNPSVTPEYLDTLSGMTGHRRARLFLGQWSAAEGLVFDNFDRSIHVVDVMPPGWESYRKVRSIDFGYTNPFVCQWWAIDGDGRAFLYREWVRQGMTVKDHADVISRLSGSERYEATVADHDSGDRATLRQCGIDTVAANKSVSPGIQELSGRLSISGDGKPRLYILRGATVGSDSKLDDAKRPQGLAAEIEGYMWQRASDGKPSKEEPVKENDHSCDAARYCMMYIGSPSLPMVWVDDDGTYDRPDLWE